MVNFLSCALYHSLKNNFEEVEEKKCMRIMKTKKHLWKHSERPWFLASDLCLCVFT